MINFTFLFSSQEFVIIFISQLIELIGLVFFQNKYQQHINLISKDTLERFKMLVYLSEGLKTVKANLILPLFVVAFGDGESEDVSKTRISRPNLSFISAIVACCRVKPDSEKKNVK